MKLFVLNLIFFCALTSASSIRIGMINNASLLTSCSYLTINASTCQECSCAMLDSSQNISILSLNCYISSNSRVNCDLFTGTAYLSSCSYQMENNASSTFYFQELPPDNLLTTEATTNAQNFIAQWNSTDFTVVGSNAGTPGVTPSLLSGPYGLAFDSSNTLYITDANNNRIQKWTVNAPNGTTVAGLENGTSGASSTALNHPVGIILDSSNNMYFTDRSNHRVMFWVNGASNGSVYAGITGVNGSAMNQLFKPTGLFLNETTGTLYIADTYNHRIMCYLANASSGTVVAGGNSQGTGSTQLSYPYDFTWDSVTNSFIIVNFAAHTVVRWVLGATSWTLLAGVSGTSGTISTLLNSPLSVVLDPYGNMYVSDSANHRIQFFLAGQSNGTTVAGITGSPGTNGTQLHTPYWTILDSQLNLYVADTSNNRIQRFPHH